MCQLNNGFEIFEWLDISTQVACDQWNVRRIQRMTGYTIIEYFVQHIFFLGINGVEWF